MIEAPTESLAAPPGTAAESDSPRTGGPRRYPGLVETVVVGFLILLVGSPLAFLLPMPDLPPEKAAAGYVERMRQEASLTHTWVTINSAIVGVPLVLFVCWRRRYGDSVSHYLGLRLPSLRQALLWTAVLLGYYFVGMSVLRFLPPGSGPHISFELFGAAPSVPLMLLAGVICAPLEEELFYRGFLLPGFANSRLGTVAAVVLTAAVWSLSHQYDVRNSANVFLAGVLLGAARLHTGSVLLTVGLHGLVNLLLQIQYARLLSS